MKKIINIQVPDEWKKKIKISKEIIKLFEGLKYEDAQSILKYTELQLEKFAIIKSKKED